MLEETGQLTFAEKDPVRKILQDPREGLQITLAPEERTRQDQAVHELQGITQCYYFC